MPVMSRPQPDTPPTATPFDDAITIDPVTTGGSGGDPTGPSVYDDERRPRRRIWPVVVGVGAVGAIVAGAVVATSGDSETQSDDPVTLRAVVAETRDLVEYSELDGTMAYADITSLTASADGTVTDVTADGAEVVRNATLFEVDENPNVVLYGGVPMYRELSEGTSGDDVEMLEQNLAALGYNTVDTDDDGNPVDEGFVVDGVYDDATADAVRRWQEDIGAPETGTVAPSSVTVVAGPSIVSAVSVEVGSRLSAGTPVLDLNTVATVEPGVFTNRAGDVEVLVSAGVELVTGDVVYSVGAAPVTAIVTDVTFDRDLDEGADDGADVQALEEMLLALGYDADGELVVDETFDDATTSAVESWQDDLQNTFDEVEVDGEVALDDLVVVAPGTMVGTLTTHETTYLASGTQLWSTETATSARVVSTSIAVSDQDRLALGTEVDVEFPGGETVTGTVVSVASSSTVDPSDAEAEATLAVEITLSTVPETVSSLNEVDVVVKLVDELAAGVTTVPVSALVATGDGGFAVQTVDSTGATQFVAVVPGMFNDGFVEVDGISAGTQVVVPA
jgi:peptidoglycan hydrolase-like protein with peptidoglycan-binding domain